MQKSPVLLSIYSKDTREPHALPLLLPLYASVYCPAQLSHSFSPPTALSASRYETNKNIFGRRRLRKGGVDVGGLGGGGSGSGGLGGVGIIGSGTGGQAERDTSVELTLLSEAGGSVDRDRGGLSPRSSRHGGGGVYGGGGGVSSGGGSSARRESSKSPPPPSSNLRPTTFYL